MTLSGTSPWRRSSRVPIRGRQYFYRPAATECSHAAGLEPSRQRSALRLRPACGQLAASLRPACSRSGLQSRRRHRCARGTNHGAVGGRYKPRRRDFGHASSPVVVMQCRFTRRGSYQAGPRARILCTCAWPNRKCCLILFIKIRQHWPLARCRCASGRLCSRQVARSAA